MGGRRTREKVFRIRYKDNAGFKTKLVIGNHPKNVSVPGRVLKIGKVAQDELFHVGEYNQLPKQLMREFKSPKGGGQVIRSPDIASP